MTTVKERQRNLAKRIAKELKALETKYTKLQLEATQTIMAGEDKEGLKFKALIHKMRIDTAPYLFYKECNNWRDVYKKLSEIVEKKLDTSELYEIYPNHPKPTAEQILNQTANKLLYK